MKPEKFNERPYQSEKEEALDYIRTLMEQARRDSKLEDIPKLEKLIELVDSKRYGLVWEEHAELVEEEMKTKIPVFIEDYSRKIEGNPSTSDYNFLLEGDNLHSLHLLSKTHSGMIDVIYIDPPYNTGNKDFVYNDKIVDKNDTYSHSKWLSFMSKRLEIAQKLLCETGVIFISIDDNEQAQLKLLCDEIFANHNFIAQCIHKNNSNKNQSKLIGVSTEYFFVYAKNIEKLRKSEIDGWKLEKQGSKDINKKYNQLKKLGLSLEEIESNIKDMYKRPKYSHLSRWNKVDEKGVFKDADLSRDNGPKDYTIINPETNEPCVIPDRGWGKSYEELLRLQKENMIWYGDQSTAPGMKSYITGEDYSVPDSFWYFDNSIDTKFLKKIFGRKVFNNPKPVDMIKNIIQMSSKKDSIILDFFAGSGTTGHAVAQLNKEDNGKRKYILCTNNENNICEEVTYKRIVNIQENLPHNLKYYKTKFINKDDEDLEYSLLNNVKTLIELEHAIDLEESDKAVAFTLSEIRELDLSGIKTVYVRQHSHALMEKEDKLRYENIELIDVPEYYFASEMREAGL
ncbi:site-specific DNA-methyltransferase [Streptococcus pseudopneumoniae]|uniref:Type III restriction-modification system methylation subunit n=1 Tax=Streptococcus pseudopneumoniae TaxID=257758 RepID=A0A2N9ZXK5_9STRE|nr:site-specific DNA-methyltransferase [Streptococcus pseudopneumoniae]CEY55406.1 type III restriction-modification system methylation subunit [Streptococcus pseudopneumoniae]